MLADKPELIRLSAHHHSSLPYNNVRHRCGLFFIVELKFFEYYRVYPDFDHRPKCMRIGLMFSRIC